MDRLISLSKKLREELDKLPLFQEYQRLKKEVDTNEELDSLKKEIVIAKKEGKVEEHKTLLNEYNNHPLVANFMATQNEVVDYLKEISDILNEK